MQLGQGKKNSSKENDDFEKIKGKLQGLKNAEVNIVVVLLPDKDVNTYTTLKRAGGVAVGVRNPVHDFSQLWSKD